MKLASEYEKSLKLLLDLNSFQDISYRNTIEVKKELIRSYIRSGNYQKSLKYANELRTIAQKAKDNLTEVIAISAQIESMTPIEKIKECLECFERGKELIFKLHLKEKKEKKIQGYFFFTVGLIFQKLNKFDIALQYFMKSMQIHKNTDNEMGMAKIYLHFGDIAFIKKFYVEAKRYLLKSIEISERYPLNTSTILANSHLGWINLRERKFEIAKYYFEVALKTSRKFNNKHCENYSIYGLGQLSLKKGNLDEAMKCFKKSLILTKSIESPIGLAYSYLNIGIICNLKGDFSIANIFFKKGLDYIRKANSPLMIMEFYKINGKISGAIGNYYQANKYLQNSISIAKKFNDVSSLSECYHFLFNILLNQSNIELAKKIHSKHEKIVKKNTYNEFIRKLYKLDQAILLKNSPRYRDKIYAQKNFSEIIYEKPIFNKIVLEALLNLCESLIFELEISKKKSILEEIDENIKKILKITEEEYIPSLHSETLFLKAKLLLIQSNREEAKQILIEAHKLAKKIINKQLINKISNFHKFFFMGTDNENSRNFTNLQLNELTRITNFKYPYSKMIHYLIKIKE